MKDTKIKQEKPKAPEGNAERPECKCCNQPRPHTKIETKSYYPDETLERLNSIDTFKYSKVGKPI